MEEFVIFKYYNVLFVLLVIGSSILASEVPRPRGVSLSRVSLYSPDKDFVCFDGSLTIPFSQVNDDYCDCPDASDEPGTSACPHGIFHCTNAGHRPLNIASSRVNDGVCDCCDASDEYANDKVQCANNCNQLGRTAREEAQRRAELIKAGKQLRAELSEKGLQLKEEKKAKLLELEKNKVEAEKLLSEKEGIKKQVEELETVALQHYRAIEEEERKKRDEVEAAKTREEALQSFTRFDSNSDGRIDLAELKTRQTFDKDKNGEVSDEEAKFFLGDLDSVDTEEFVTNCWPKIKPFVMMESGMFKPPVVEGYVQPDEGEVEQTGHDDGEDAEEVEETEGENEEDEEEEEETAEEKPTEPPVEQPKYDENTQKLIDQANAARKEFDDADREVRNIQTDIKAIEEYLEKDFGPDEEFAALEGQCFEYSDYEYVYKLCPFDKAVQTPKSNSLETRLGIWSKWTGQDDNKYDVMLYDRGQSCWNGPQRTTHVRVTCGSENQVTAVSEPNRCEYLFDFTTPAACREIQTDQTDDVHDEL